MVALLVIFSGAELLPSSSSALSGEEAFKNALNLFKKKDYQQAWQILQNLPEETLDPSSAGESIFLKGQILHHLSKWPEAAQAFSRAAILYPLLADYALYYQANSLCRAGELEESLEIFQRLISLFPNSLCLPLAELKMAEIYGQLKDYKRSGEICRQMLSRILSNDYVPPALFLLGQAEEGMQEWKKAIQTYQEIWLKYPLHTLAEKSRERWQKISREKKLPIEKFPPQLLFQRALHFYRARLFATALKELENIPRLPLNEFPSFYNGEFWIDELYFHRGMCLFYLKQYAKAAEVFKLVTRSARNELNAERSMLWLSRSLYRAGRKEEALLSLMRFKNAYPRSSLIDQALYLQAQILEEQREINKAIALYQEIGERFPHSSWRFQGLWQAGWLFFKARDWRNALQIWDKLQALNPNSPWIEKILYWKGRAFQELGEQAPAEENYQLLIKNYPATYYALLTSGQGHLPEHRNILATPIEEKNLEPFLRKDGQLPGLTHLEKGRALSHLGLWPEALRELAAAEEEGKFSTEIKKEISRLYRDMGEYSRSALLVRKNFRLRPLTPALPDSEKKLYLLAYPVGNISWINYYARIRNLDPALLCALILEESRFNSQALSVAGARGLMQLIPPTAQMIARQLNINSLPESSLFEPEVNLQLGTWYLTNLLKEFSGKISFALAAYNAGPQVVKEWISQGNKLREDEFIESVPYPETRNYVIRVLTSFQVYRTLYSSSKGSLIKNY